MTTLNTPVSLIWSEPKTIKGTWLLRIADPDSAFWDWWKHSPTVSSYKDGGVKPRKNDYSGRWELQWWRKLGDDLEPPTELSWEAHYVSPKHLQMQVEAKSNELNESALRTDLDSPLGASNHSPFALRQTPEQLLKASLEAYEPEPLSDAFYSYLKGKKDPFGQPLALKEYQKKHTATLAAALAQNSAALDASDTGVGKTPCALAAFVELGLRQSLSHGLRYKILIICPLSVIPSWKRWLRAFHLDGEVWNYEKMRMGKSRFGKFEGERQKKKFVWSMPEELDSAPWAVILDESHKIKSPNTQQGMMARHAAGQGFPVLMLSATNAKDPVDMRNSGAILRLHTGRRVDWTIWCQRYGCGATRYGLKFRGNRNDLARLHFEVFPIRGSRMRIAELGDAFPRNTVLAEAWELDTSKDIERGYMEAEIRCEEIEADTSLSRMEKSSSILAEMMKARVRAEKGKWPEMVERAKDMIEEGCSPVLALNFRAHVMDAAKALGDETMVIMGGQTGDQRQAIVERFGQDKARFVVVSIMAGGAGLDGLQDLRGEFPRVSFISPSYSAIDLQQFIGRINRANSQSASRQFIVFAANTIEEEACNSVQDKLLNLAMMNDGSLCHGLRFMADRE